MSKRNKSEKENEIEDYDESRKIFFFLVLLTVMIIWTLVNLIKILKQDFVDTLLNYYCIDFILIIQKHKKAIGKRCSYFSPVAEF